MAAKSTNKVSKGEDAIWYIITYVLTILSGIIVLIVKGEGNARLKFHSMQAIFLGIVMIIISIIFGFFFFGFISSILNFLLWLYGIYVGFQAYNGIDVDMPVIGDYARQYSHYGSSKK